MLVSGILGCSTLANLTWNTEPKLLDPAPDLPRILFGPLQKRSWIVHPPGGLIKWNLEIGCIGSAFQALPSSDLVIPDLNATTTAAAPPPATSRTAKGAKTSKRERERDTERTRSYAQGNKQDRERRKTKRMNGVNELAAAKILHKQVLVQ